MKTLELFENGDPVAPRGLLLTGPPGGGKSLLGTAIADAVGCNFQHLTPASLKLDHLGGSRQKVRKVWEKARQEQPSILYLDECEGVLGRRGAAETDTLSMEIVQAFLAERDGLTRTIVCWSLAQREWVGFLRNHGRHQSQLPRPERQPGEATLRTSQHAPCILFLDELDILTPDRSIGDDDPLTREIVGQLLQEIDGVHEHPEHVFLLGATNRSKAVDKAFSVVSLKGCRFQCRTMLPTLDFSPTFAREKAGFSSAGWNPLARRPH